MPADAYDQELIRGWDEASRGSRFKVFESRAWRNGWRLWTVREGWRRYHAALA